MIIIQWRSQSLQPPPHWFSFSISLVMPPPIHMPSFPFRKPLFNFKIREKGFFTKLKTFRIILFLNFLRKFWSTWRGDMGGHSSKAYHPLNHIDVESPVWVSHRQRPFCNPRERRVCFWFLFSETSSKNRKRENVFSKHNPTIPKPSFLEGSNRIWEREGESWRGYMGEEEGDEGDLRSRTRASGPPKWLTSFQKDLTAGAVMGGVVHTIVAPIERAKLLLQTQESNVAIIAGRHRRFKGMCDCIVRTVREEGILSLWRGNGSSVLRYYPSVALNFSLKVCVIALPFAFLLSFSL